ncbi:metalloprotease 1 [Cordyceps fumosorosea ARSEF 2679]|uniref:Metalloprotease 1 n=1 Tax=Cordyceps fumosorosea (strain ARSEF 2679) TaxID=1081104 RepID=A0A162IDQ6_CORFA|nr:metalloprotease 1 [Cordyceps fumosorosea ARSEF 2679]OAA55695.1 metalloprotease 1 [Cordyceps fumosorosea ARSEF 2679]
MHLSTRIVAAALAALPLAAAWPAELTRNAEGFCHSTPSSRLLALHESIVKGEQETLDMIAKGEAIIEEALAKTESGLQARGDAGMTVTRRDSGALITLDAWFHVVYSSKTAKGGYLTSQNIKDQLSALNKAFDPSNIAFNLVNTTYTQNSDWAASTDGSQSTTRAMKSKLHQGDARTLNLYFLPGYDVNGECTFPDEIDPNDPATLRNDGCQVGSFTLPGNDNVFNMALTAVHEVGHWLGLLHTFQGGCDEEGGDYISDTPAEKTSNYGKCPAGRDTCPDLPGLDPIDNYMDYSRDSCYSKFTAEQIKRQRSILAGLRVGNSA